MEIKELIELDKMNRKQFDTDKDYYNFLTMQIQMHLVEIDDLRNKSDPHLVKEVADIAILSKMLALSEGADESTFNERIEKVKSKIKEKKKKKN